MHKIVKDSMALGDNLIVFYLDTYNLDSYIIDRENMKIEFWIDNIKYSDKIDKNRIYLDYVLEPNDYEVNRIPETGVITGEFNILNADKFYINFPCDEVCFRDFHNTHHVKLKIETDSTIWEGLGALDFE